VGDGTGGGSAGVPLREGREPAPGGLYRDHAIVLRTYKLAEVDRIVVLVGARHGKVRGVAKGVRKPSSRIGARLEPLSHVAVQLYRGRGDLDRITQVETVDAFRPVRDDLSRLSKGLALLEAVDQLTPERVPDVRRYQMLLGALRTLAAGDRALLVPAFLLKLLAADGMGPELDHCVVCGSTEDLVSFDPEDGGVRCRQDRRGLPVSDMALALTRAVLGGALNTALDVTASAATHEVDVIAMKLFEHHVERRLRAAALLEHLD
jgi:DNA repair protein RecO (recombination protein O)